MNLVFKIAIFFTIAVLNNCHTATAESLTQFRSFTADKKAFRIGDTVTILLVEKTQAESSANTRSGQSLGIGGELNGSLGRYSRDYDATLGIRKKRDGDAVTRRNGFLNGEITATVTTINEFGHLVVEGEKVIVINGEEQAVRVRGYLRQEDIANNNTVFSNRLTNARIEFTGEGVVGDVQRKGWIARLFDWIGFI